MEKKIEEINTKLEQYETKLSTSKIQLKRSEDREKLLQTQLNMAMQVSGEPILLISLLDANPWIEIFLGRLISVLTVTSCRY